MNEAEYRKLWVKWTLAQVTAIYCLVHAVFVLLYCALRLPGMWWGLPLAVLFYGLHWRFQMRAFELDPVRSDRIVALVKMQQSRFDPDW